MVQKIRETLSTYNTCKDIFNINNFDVVTTCKLDKSKNHNRRRSICILIAI